MIKQSRKPVTWLVIGIFVASLLMLLASGYEATSLTSYFHKSRDGVPGNDSQRRIFTWLLWSNSSASNIPLSNSGGSDTHLADDNNKLDKTLEVISEDRIEHPTSDSLSVVEGSFKLPPIVRPQEPETNGKPLTNKNISNSDMVIGNPPATFTHNVGPDPAAAHQEATTLLSDRCSFPLKVFMYDLPRKYNLGMLRRDDKDQELPWNASVVPSWPQRSGLWKQHSVEYWMMVDLLDDRRDGDKAALRVKEPEEADVFFVPFFSSLSYNAYANKMRNEAGNIDNEFQADMTRYLKKSRWWQASQGRDHILFFHHPNAFRSFRDQFNASVLIVADFGRYRKTTARLQKDVVAPYVHILPTFENDTHLNPFESRTTLLYFQGRVRRKDGGVVRRRMAKLLRNQKDVHYSDGMPSLDGVDQATAGMRNSRFCLNPAGDTPSSCRLFDAIVNHCVPVIISDRIELPFEDELDYKEFCLFFSVKEALKPNLLVNHLKSFKKEQWLVMWNRLKEVACHYEYHHPSKRDDAVNMIWKQIQRRVPNINLSINRAQRLKIADWWRRKS